jgi:hypothetical protein
MLLSDIALAALCVCVCVCLFVCPYVHSFYVYSCMFVVTRPPVTAVCPRQCVCLPHPEEREQMALNPGLHVGTQADRLLRRPGGLDGARNSQRPV